MRNESRRAIALAFAFVGGAHALVAQEGESQVAKEVVAAPEPKDALSLRIELLSDARQCTGRFAKFSDVHLLLMMQNRGTSPLLLAVDEAAQRWGATPNLVALEVTRDDGKPLVLPRFEVGTLFAGDRVEQWIWQGVPVRWVGAGGSLGWSIPLRDVPGWQSIELSPGAYRIRATYRGPPDLPAHVHADAVPDPEAGAKAAWRGALVSSTLRFEITDSTPELTWSEPQKGLRIAPIPDPRGDRFMIGETIELATMLENATDEPMVVVREVDCSEDDGLAISTADRKDLCRGASMSTGINDRVRLTLPPRVRLRIHAAPVRFDSDRIVAGNRVFDFAGPGRYTLRQTIEIESPIPPKRTFLEVPAREIELLARR
jgi:hypothetical protein